MPCRSSAPRTVMGANGLAAEPRGAPSAFGARSCSPVGTGSKVTCERARPGAVTHYGMAQMKRAAAEVLPPGQTRNDRLHLQRMAMPTAMLSSSSARS